MTEKEAYKKAVELAELLGIQTIKHNKDGSKTIHKPKIMDREININDIIEVLMK